LAVVVIPAVPLDVSVARFCASSGWPTSTFWNENLPTASSMRKIAPLGISSTRKSRTSSASISTIWRAAMGCFATITGRVAGRAGAGAGTACCKASTASTPATIANNTPAR